MNCVCEILLRYLKSKPPVESIKILEHDTRGKSDFPWLFIRPWDNRRVRMTWKKFACSLWRFSTIREPWQQATFYDRYHTCSSESIYLFSTFSLHSNKHVAFRGIRYQTSTNRSVVTKTGIHVDTHPTVVVKNEENTLTRLWTFH